MKVLVVDPDAVLTKYTVPNGHILKYPYDEMEAPFKVETRDGDDYYVVLKDISHNGRNNMSFYVKGGQTCEIDVPLGNYELYYASGENWYGLEHLFGSKTVYTKSDSSLKFYISGNYVNGNSVTFYKVTNGNMSTQTINASQFPTL